MSTTLVSGVATLAVSQEPLPPGSAAFASESVVVTDAAGTVNPPVVLTGAETPPFSWAATYAAGTANAVVTPLDVNGNVIPGFTLTTTFSVQGAVSPGNFPAGTGISFVPAAPVASAAAKK